jgi:hypothetical protein
LRVPGAADPPPNHPTASWPPPCSTVPGERPGLGGAQGVGCPILGGSPEGHDRSAIVATLQPDRDRVARPATVGQYVAALVAVPDPPSLIDLRRRVEKMLPKIDLPELVLEVMSWHPGFIEAFTHVSGNDARVADLGLGVEGHPPEIRR